MSNPEALKNETYVDTDTNFDSEEYLFGYEALKAHFNLNHEVGSRALKGVVELNMDSTE